MQAKQVIDYIVGWLKTYCNNAGMEGFAVWVSGGIDSAVTSTLCARTASAVLVLNMPIYQDSDQESLSAQHILWLEKQFPNVKGIRIDLTSAFKALENTFPSEIQDGLTMANTRARLRMLALYAFAGHNRMLVAGTGNRVEDFGVGFFTKYGDGGVDLSPIADLMKSEVYKIGRELGIIEAVLNAPSTDGLWPDNRSDEEQIGATYDELEWAMGFDGGSQGEGGLSNRQKEVLAIYRKYRKANRHKMEPIPMAVIPKGLK
jgi:NAD+ synthase